MSLIIDSYCPNSKLFYFQGNWITQKTFIAHSFQLAKTLSKYKSTCFINLCNNRYLFAVAFAASLLLKQKILMPPSSSPSTINQLTKKHTLSLCICDYKTDELQTKIIDIRDDISKFEKSIIKEPHNILDEQIAAIVFTSGSTGKPKKIYKRWGALIGTVKALQTRFAPQLTNTSQKKCIVSTVPSQHMYGFEMTILIGFLGGTYIHSEKPFYPMDIKKCIEEVNAPVILVTTPVHLKVLIETELYIEKIDSIISATAILPPELAQEAESTFKAEVHEIYGFSEAGSVATKKSPSEEPWKLLDGLHINPGKSNSSYIFAEHFNKKITIEDNINLIGCNQFYLEGRKDDLIKIGGKRVSLAAINNSILSIEGIKDSAVIMIPKTQRITAFVVSKTLSTREIAEILSSKVDNIFIPRPIKIVNCIPRNKTGKIVKSSLLAITD